MFSPTVGRRSVKRALAAYASADGHLGSAAIPAANRIYISALVISAVLQVVHTIALPLLITWDGHGYVRLAHILNDARAAGNWDYLRTPLYPAALKLFFAFLGESAGAVLLLQALYGFAGTVLLGSVMRRVAGTGWAAACILLLSFHPALITYQHILLTEPGTYFFLALTMWVAVVPVRYPARQAAAVAFALAAGFYHRQSLLYVAPAAGLVFLIVHAMQAPGRADRIGAVRKRTLAYAAGIACVPFLLAWPWQQLPAVKTRINGGVLAYGMAKQALIPPGHEVWGPARSLYEDVIRQSTRNGSLPLDGLRHGLELSITEIIVARSQDVSRLFVEVVVQAPWTYVRKVTQTWLYYAGIAGWPSDSALFRETILSGGAATIIGEGPPGGRNLRPEFSRQSPNVPGLRRVLRVIAPLYDVLMFLSVLALPFGVVIGVAARNPALVAASLLASCFLAANAAVLNAQDRMAAPALGLALTSFLLILRWAWARCAATVSRNQPRRCSILLFTALLVVGVGAHSVYAVLSRSVLSADEAHYTTGVHAIAAAFGHGPVATWHAFTSALGFKPPLICIPGAFLVPFTRDPIFAARCSLVVIFAGLAVVSYIWFRRVLGSLWGMCATTILITAPLITGLTHRVYTEGLLLLLILLFLDLLLRANNAGHLSLMLIAGGVAGLGLLCKTTFPVLVAIPAAWVLWCGYRQARGAGRTVAFFGALTASMAIAAAVAWPWYSRNWVAATNHVRMAAACPTCSYPAVNSFLAVISSGPQFWASVLAAAALIPTLKGLLSRAWERESSIRWTVLLLLGAVSLVLYLTGVNKSVRNAVTLLPAIAALAAVSLHWLASKSGRPLLTGTVCVLLSVVGLLHGNFGVPPITVRAGDLRLFDTRHALNPPHWFTDNHPLDTRDLDLERIEAFIAADRAPRAGHAATTVGVTYHGLSVNFDYLLLIAQIRAHPLRFLPHYALPADAGAIDYLVSCSGCERLNPGEHNFNALGTVLENAAAQGVEFEPVFSHNGPERVTLKVLRRVSREFAAESIPGTIQMEAEQFTGGNVSIDKGELGYGTGIGVIVTHVFPAFAEYTIVVERGRGYRLELRCASAEFRPVRVLVNGRVARESVCGAASGGFGPQDQRWQPGGVLTLTKGRNLLRLEGAGPFPHIDKLRLVPVN
jgi:4-amino-4-deoxy-L-arabinose transferase-like glycosyltransferase